MLWNRVLVHLGFPHLHLTQANFVKCFLLWSQCSIYLPRCLPAHSGPKHSLQTALLVPREQKSRPQERPPVLRWPPCQIRLPAPGPVYGASLWRRLLLGGWLERGGGCHRSHLQRHQEDGLRRHLPHRLQPQVLEPLLLWFQLLSPTQQRPDRDQRPLLITYRGVPGPRWGYPLFLHCRGLHVSYPPLQGFL